ncbi:DUF3068 domain-containing protein [Gordonia terrae]|uniref:DUF3068 domain-containing protein n=1 Tax=Gordonia terrae TaxID=2055 RepID=A0AAD0NXA7_9ACTN|nr:DUF3068 domain-containing protein [Gordonia terrae]ANY25294.1 hypothetical protein BCM27_23005 [Gordonia terrae]AWO86046.1 DUF3068 domain-containing protein [Gordonia terrae]VTS62617.1 Protein of uncharacterised function (DUF3068) [Gordonia terrae]
MSSPSSSSRSGPPSSGLSSDTETRPEPHRWSAADLAGPTLIFVGAFLLAVTIALPTLLVGGFRTIPLSTDFTTVATADDATIFDRCSLETRSARAVDADLVRQQRVVAVQPSDEHRVTLQAGTSIQAQALRIDGREVDPGDPRPGVDPGGSQADDPAQPCNDATVNAIKDRVTLDRKNALPRLAARGASEIQYDSGQAAVLVPDRRGVTYLLPFDTEPADREFFDAVTRTTVPLVYDGDTEVHGRDVDRFRAEVPDTDLARAALGRPVGTNVSITRPASWFGVGDTSRPLTANLHHRSSWDLAVDPRTGTIVDATITVDEVYRFPDGTPGVPADFKLPHLRATFAYDEDTQTRMTDLASDLATPILIWGRLVPIGTAVLGVVALLAGLVLTNPAWLPARFRRRRGAETVDGQPE